MPTPDYPATLPGAKDWRLQPAAQTLSTEPPAPLELRRRSRVPNASGTVVWQFVESDYATFVAWWRNDLLRGHKKFWINLPSAGGETLHVAQFTEPFRARNIGANAVEVTARLEILERRFAPFTKPIDPFWANVVGLYSYNDASNGTSFANTKGGALVRQGSYTANFDTSDVQAKFGRALALATRTGSSSIYTAVQTGLSYPVGAANLFTLEGWIYWTGDIDNRISPMRFDTSNLSRGGGIVFYTASQLNFRTQLSTQHDLYFSPPLNQWAFLAASYDGTTKRVFANGTLIASATVAPLAAGFLVERVEVAGIASGSFFSPFGYLDEWRLTAGICRYTSNFVPPATPFLTGS